MILLALVVLAMLVLVGLAVLVGRAVMLWRVTKAAQQRVDAPVREMSAGLRRAEERVAHLTSSQGDLTEAIERVGLRAGELGRLLSIAGSALAVLRAPMKYLGK